MEKVQQTRNEKLKSSYLRKFAILLTYVLFYAVIIILIARVCAYTYEFAYEIFGSQTVENAPGHEVAFEVREGESIREVAQNLEKAQLIARADTFYVRAVLDMDEKKPLLPGHYSLNTSMNYGEILNSITGTGGNAP